MEEGSGAIISSLCWVQRGYAKEMLENYEPSEQDIEMHKKMIEKKMSRKEKRKNKDKEAKEKQEKVENDIESYGSDDEEHVPTYTAELAKLKEKEMKELGELDDEM